MKLFPHLIFLCGFLCGIFSRLRILKLYKIILLIIYSQNQNRPSSVFFMYWMTIEKPYFDYYFLFSYDELSFLLACSFCTSLYQPWLMFYHIFMNQSVEWILNARSNINTVIPKMPKHDLKLRAIKIWGITVQ